jgi:hypothetical protein
VRRFFRPCSDAIGWLRFRVVPPLDDLGIGVSHQASRLQTDSRQLPVSAAGQDKQARAERVKRNGKNNATGALTWINVLKKGKTAFRPSSGYRKLVVFKRLATVCFPSR